MIPCNCRYCCEENSGSWTAGLPANHCATCGDKSPTLQICENSPCRSRRHSQYSPKRVLSVSGADDFASIAADSIKVSGGFKQFKQVKFIDRKYITEEYI